MCHLVACRHIKALWCHVSSNVSSQRPPASDKGQGLRGKPPKCGHYLYCFYLLLCLMHSDFTSQRSTGLEACGFLTKTLDGINVPFSRISPAWHQCLLAGSPPTLCFWDNCCCFKATLGFLIPDIQLPSFTNHQPLTASSSAGFPVTSASTDKMPQLNLTA